jgi:small-conductance mechanosensitive channel
VSAAAAAQGADDNITVILRPGQEQGQIDAVLGALKNSGRPVTIRWEEPGSAAALPATSTSDPAPAAPTGLWSSFEAGLALGIQGLARIGELPRDFAERWRRIRNGTTLGVLGRFVGLVAAAALCAWIVHRLLRSLLGADQARPDHLGRFSASVRRLFVDLAALGIFVLVGRIGLGHVLPAADLAHDLGERLLDGVALAALYIVVGRFLLMPADAGGQLLQIPNPSWHFGMLTAYGVFGAFIGQTVRLAQRLESDAVAIEGWFLLTATLITLLKLWWFWGGRHDIAALVRGHRGDNAVGLLHGMAAASLPWLFIAAAVLIWVVGCIAAVAPQRAHWGAAAGITQILVIVVPLAAMGIDALAHALIARRHREGAPRPLRAATAAVARTLVTGSVWVLGLYAIMRVWSFYLLDPASGTTLAAIGAAVRIGAALAVGWAIWSFLNAYFTAYAPKPRSSVPGDPEEHEAPAQGRLATVLPLVRDLALGAVIAVTGLAVLSGFGVDIGPLLAGFGVVGLAISFGSQSLVRDIVSGIFFMADDAFRLGEYIDTGKLKGTVEKITLRSVQLRHQNGQIHTVPFGQLQAITNFSRDWATMKFTIRLDREADIEKARKTIKKVGQQMQEDPELGPEFILPLKMQGIQDITDTAIVIRLKFTCRPAKPTYLQREALKRVYRALQEATVPLASGAVTVRSGASEPAAAAAATSSTRT